jgi:3(or 17)beta-hydroxysteroid dehydrogenase
MGRVDHKIALVTGGASGIGFAAAGLLADEGAKIVLTDLDKPRADAAMAALGKRARFHELDVTREADWIAVTDAVVSEFGRLDILVNSAGVSLLKDIEATTLDEWRSLMAVNLDGTFLGCKHAIRVMKERGGGSIVNMSSVAGLVGAANLAGYSASKGGVRLLTKSVALHCARKGYNIRCNLVHPSFVETPMLQSMLAMARDPRKLEANYAKAAPLGRFAKPIEVARTILSLASDESAFTTGAEMVVDGGLTAG